MAVVLAILMGLFAGAVSARREFRVGRPRLVGILWVVVAAQIAVVLLPNSLLDRMVWPVVLITNAGVGAFLMVNAIRGGALRPVFAVAAAGWAMNVVVIVANGAMPVSMYATGGRPLGRAIGMRTGFLFDHVPATPSTSLRWLGDIIPVRVGPTLSVVSPGDVLLLVALSMGVAMAVRARGARLVRPALATESS